MATTEDGQRVTVTATDAGLERIDDLVEQLQGEGMAVDQVLESIGVIVGSVPAERRAAITALDDVAAVEGETTFELPPPDAEVQ